uniref:Uncharacterized protein n=1 Tax=Globodera rostochiensis TaxID=31243 RepID=A0A914IGC6_GLORO
MECQSSENLKSYQPTFMANAIGRLGAAYFSVGHFGAACAVILALNNLGAGLLALLISGVSHFGAGRFGILALNNLGAGLLALLISGLAISALVVSAFWR